MGNCFKAGSSDDVSLLRGNYVHPDPTETPRSDHSRSQPTVNLPAPAQQAPSNSSSQHHTHVHRRRARSELTQAQSESASTAAVSNSFSEQPPNYDASQSGVQYFYIAPNVRRSAQQLTEEEQVKIAKRIGLINHLPTGIFDGSNENEKQRECIICMCEYVVGDQIRFLPCLHAYHRSCIDDWLMRSFTCPSCLEPVDSALLTSYENTNCAQSDSS